IAAANPSDINATLGTAPLTFATSPPAGAFVQQNWISDESSVALVRDRNLVNPWGLAFGPTTPLWVSDNGSDRSTSYKGGNGTSPPSIVPRAFRVPDGAPPGTVYNPTGDFFVHSGTQKDAAQFIFASENGDIDGWAPAVGTATPPSTTAVHVLSVA